MGQVGGGGDQVGGGSGGEGRFSGGGGVGTVGDGGWVQVEDGLGSGGEVWLVHMGGELFRWGGGGLSWKRGLRGEGVDWGRGLMGGGVLSVGGGGEINGIYLQIEFRFRNGLGRTVALQSFGITCLINAEIFANFSTTREATIKWKKSILM